ncbi:MAG: hypothetical protein ACRDNF_20320 [Streptosporangiaceae bacterium]
MLTDSQRHAGQADIVREPVVTTPRIFSGCCHNGQKHSRSTPASPPAHPSATLALQSFALN